jgi:hypothetical protein
VQDLDGRVCGLYTSDVGDLPPVAERVLEAQWVLVPPERLGPQMALQPRDVFLLLLCRNCWGTVPAR